MYISIYGWHDSENPVNENDLGVNVELPDTCLEYWQDGPNECIAVELASLPPGVTHIIVCSPRNVIGIG